MMNTGRNRGFMILLCWVLAVVWMPVAAGLPWAPTAALAKGSALVSGGAGALLCLLVAAIHRWRQRRLVRRPAGAWILIVGMLISGAVGLWSLFVAYGEFAVGGEELRQTFEDRAHSKRLFIYVRFVVPDGDLSSRIAVQRGSWPFERTALNVNEVFLYFGRSDAEGLMLEFTGNVTARYRFEDGSVRLQ